VSARIWATSGRVNQSGSSTPLFRNCSRTWVPEIEATFAPVGTLDDSS